ncbi:histone deacetylase HDT1-like [Camellia sinensis]|uniref:histone deacetylase HDT1-like n=1 Tax=Camellia sinensis TaxID=4442 RepID=UPI001035CB71|nr:histone deacetylase HDT1-like [Camellia sinensis]
MEFWGVEVKAGQPLKVTPQLGKVIHISQGALGEGKKEKGNDLIPLRVKINGEKFVVGSLSAENFPQVAFDLVFEKDFELSHDWKNGSVYFCGYSADNPFVDDDEFESDDSSDDEDIPLPLTENGKIESKVEEVKPDASKGKAAKPESSAKPKVTVVEPKKDDESDDDDSDDSFEDDSDDEDMMGASDDIGDSDDDDTEDDDSEDEDDETPKKAGPAKKRATESATKTPVPAKKAKLDTPQKTGGKKGGGHTATPHPSKQVGKTNATANSNKSNEKSPKSEAKVSCKSCSKTFNSDNALQSHTKAKHDGK